MRHRKKSRRLVGKWEHRKALLRNLLIALFIHERIQTTEAKAKELRRLADKMIGLAKRGDLAARRQALSILPDKAVIRKLFSEIKDRYAYRQSGFTRIVRIGPRRGDAAMMVIIELVTDKLEHKPAAKKEVPAAPVSAPETKAEPEVKAEENLEAESQVESEAEEPTPEAKGTEETPIEEAEAKGEAAEEEIKASAESKDSLADTEEKSSAEESKPQESEKKE
ncbi:ribosomal protein L17 [Thermodesulfatator indicus DSM 15286]|uniref:Large ribosomal subunit protein bL17 n=1 Tax=Thermodesulfatator indicus (strain DSM 15286 / JCM 11887 / CIR29812) TaxID=667014 RepID=F8AA63_THEID|nr:ribosomal protein L17 [Thermodesulfatator indicus DSM 15286]